MPLCQPEVIRLEKYTEIFDWLNAIRTSPVWYDLLSVWRLIPEYMWVSYTLHGQEGLQEQILLNKAQAALRKAWKNKRPHFFSHKFKDHNAPVNEGSGDGAGS